MNAVIYWYLLAFSTQRHEPSIKKKKAPEFLMREFLLVLSILLLVPNFLPFQSSLSYLFFHLGMLSGSVYILKVGFGLRS